MYRTQVSLLVLIAAMLPAAATAVVYVKPGGVGDGASWETAYGSIQTAVTNGAGQDIWVAAGAYAESGQIVWTTGTKAYGGFAGNEIQLVQRNYIANPTILSGSGAHRVILMNGGVNQRLDGFTIQDGRVDTADNDAPSYTGWTGGGIRCNNLDGTTVIANCTIRNCVSALDADSGAGVTANQCSGLVLENCTFDGNTALKWGGGLMVFHSSVQAADCTFNANTSTSMFGGAACLIQGQGAFSRCSFTNNTAIAGGAVYATTDTTGSTLDVADCMFVANTTLATSGFNGGALCMEGTGSTYTVKRSWFRLNRTQSTGTGGGGAYVGDQAQGAFTNCIFDRCTAATTSAGVGGALFVRSGSPGATIANVMHCTFSNCSAANRGRTINVDKASGKYATCNVLNSIIWTSDTTSTTSHVHVSGTAGTGLLNIGGSLIRFYGTSGANAQTYTDKPGNKRTNGTTSTDPFDPLFVDASTGALRIQSGSPAKDAGISTTPAWYTPLPVAVPAEDLLADARPVDGGAPPLPDMGAHECNTTVPAVLSIERMDPSPTRAALIRFLVTLDEGVGGQGNGALVGFSTDNFALVATGVTGAGIVSVSGAGATRTVLVDKGAGPGTIRLDLAGWTGAACSGNLPAPPGDSFTGGQTYTLGGIAAVPVMTGITVDTGVSDSDWITNDPTLLFTGTAEAAGVVDLQIAANPGGPYNILATALPVDGSGNWTFSPSGAPFGNGTYYIQARATNSLGDHSAWSGDQPLVVDLIAPTASCTNVTRTLTQGGTVTATDVDAGSHDNTGGAGMAAITLDTGDIEADCAHAGSHNAILRVTDKAGNTSTCTATITIADNEAPTVSISGGNSLNSECGAPIILPSATAADNCPGVSTVTITNMDGLEAENPASGVYHVIYQAADAADNPGEATLLVTVADSQPPAWTIPENAVIECPDTCTEDEAKAGVLATDGCAGPLPVSVTATRDGAPAPFPLSDRGVYALTYTASDGHTGLQTNTGRTVTIADTVKPSFLGVPPYIAIFSTACPYDDTSALQGVSALDNCDNEVPVTVDVSGGFPITNPPAYPAQYTLTYSAGDDAGNIATKAIILTVTNNHPPEITLLGDPMVTLECKDPYTAGEDAGVTVHDEESGDALPVITEGLPVDTEVTGVHEVTYRVEDPVTHITVPRVRNILVKDTVPPVLTLNGRAAMYVLVGADFTDPGATAMDACAGNISSSVIRGGDTVNTSAPGAYELHYNVTDPAMNPADAVMRTVIVTEPSQLSLLTVADTVNVVLGEKAELKVLAVDPVGPVVYSWYKLMPDKALRQINDAFTETLTIDHASREDAGEYQCAATDAAGGQAVSLIMTLFVTLKVPGPALAVLAAMAAMLGFTAMAALHRRKP